MFPYLSVNEDYRSQKPPRSSLPIHVQHAQDLQETDPPATHNKDALAVVLDRRLFVVLDWIISGQWKTKGSNYIAMITVPDGGCGEYLSIGAHTEHNDRSYDHN